MPKRKPLFPILRTRRNTQQIPPEFRKMPKEVEEALIALTKEPKRTRVAAE